MNNDTTINFSGADYLPIKNTLSGFAVEYFNESINKSENPLITFCGSWIPQEDKLICPQCGTLPHKNNHHKTKIKHIPIASYTTEAAYIIVQYECPACGKTFTPQPEFKHPNHRISLQLYNYLEQQLASNLYTLTDISCRTGVCINVVKSIDKKRLAKKYTIDGLHLKPPERQAYKIGIDEFKLHNHYKFATHIIDLETGDILFISHGKKKQVVYDFIDLVGDEYMKNIMAMACDMNSDFYDAIKEKYPHIDIVFDHFHVIKNFNEKVISNIRKEEQQRLMREGKFDAARRLKGTKYILTASRKTLEKRDKEREEGKVIAKGSALFNKDRVVRNKEYMRTYNLLLVENELFLKIDMIKDFLNQAFNANNPHEMSRCLAEIVSLCNETENTHFK